MGHHPPSHALTMGEGPAVTHTTRLTGGWVEPEGTSRDSSIQPPPLLEARAESQLPPVQHPACTCCLPSQKHVPQPSGLMVEEDRERSLTSSFFLVPLGIPARLVCSRLRVQEMDAQVQHGTGGAEQASSRAERAGGPLRPLTQHVASWAQAQEEQDQGGGCMRRAGSP